MDRIGPIAPRAWTQEMRAAMTALLPPAPRHPLPKSEGKPVPLNMLGILRIILCSPGHSLPSMPTLC